ncbi:uncharacterized protein CTRU02_208216 [Colletotrichum truncatum]|uniref:Uncharacterized protein n=1 Tax=Colletotrichum truncatum TaxID=5467 RepID=A0ACC3YVN8_COLTU|nr:uncharacterized protein CTRU02_07604 [Colletotrichum truncatum]KAF6791264.1 hypothetical protein CTRU02_07604 [Colletotrichum truncatum]
MASNPNNQRPRFPVSSLKNDGWSTEDEATATCLCGAVQLVFRHHSNILRQPTHGPGLGTRGLCHCADCRKISSSMFCSIFVVDDNYLRHVRGRENLKTFSQSRTTASSNTMTNYFCNTCGGLLYRVSSGLPGKSILRLGTIDDISLAETKMKPQIEIFTESRVGWQAPLDGIKQSKGGTAPEDGA